LTAHRVELASPWRQLAKGILLPVGVVLIAVWGVGLGIVKVVEAPFRIRRWISDGRPAWDDGVGGPAIDDEDEPWR